MFGFNPWVLLGGLLGGLALLVTVGVGSYLKGDSAGANRVLTRQAKAERRAVDQMIKTTSVMNAISGKVADMRRDQDTETRTINNEAVRIVDRPIYLRPGCIDADGLSLLDRAAANANRSLTSLPINGTGAPAPSSP